MRRLWVFFKSYFAKSWVDRPTLDGVHFLSLSKAEAGGMIVPFSEEDIRRVVLESDGTKSPGPDGFNFSFYKRFWDLLKGEVGIMFNQFFHFVTLPRSFSSYFIILIPKVSSPIRLGDFRPISLLGSLYKLVAKMLAGRLAPIMDNLISSNQSAFIKGRQLVDGVVAVNDIIDLARKKKKKECLIFRVNFEKAYDSVSWIFLAYMLDRLGFSERWCRWIRACVFCGNLSVLVNGCPTEEVNIQRGLKQGDPLAPFLFLLVVEGLSGLIHSVVEKGLYQGFKVGNSDLSISHLKYADDTLFLGDALMANLWALKTILRCFELASSLKVNFSKSYVMGVKRSRSIPWVSWSVVCKPKREGGLGVRDLRQVNLALLGKWRWRFLVGDGGVWRNIILARYGECHPSPDLGGRPSSLRGASSWWSNISLLGGDRAAS